MFDKFIFHQIFFMKVGENQLVFPDTVNVSIALCNFEVRFRPLVNFCKAVGDLFVEPSSRVLRVA